MSQIKNNTICTRPFEWCEIHSDGSVFLCCPAWLKRPVGNILTQSLEQIWNSAIAREIRKSMFNSSFHNCNRKRCPFLASNSDPVTSIDKISDTEVREAILNRGARLPYPPKKLNLCFDHSCNLACPSCRTEKQQAQGKNLEQAERIAELLLEHWIPTAEEITLSGFGDPFGSPTYLKLLHQINELQHPPQLRLHSNGQLWTKALWESLPNLHGKIIEAEISIDAGTAETYNVNRPGGSFEKLLDNLNYLGSLGYQLKLSMVVQQNNFREISQLIAFAEQLNATVYLSQLLNWGTLTREEYAGRAVHLPTHPEHSELRSLLAKISLHNTVELGNLRSTLPASELKSRRQ